MIIISLPQCSSLLFKCFKEYPSFLVCWKPIRSSNCCWETDTPHMCIFVHTTSIRQYSLRIHSNCWSALVIAMSYGCVPCRIILDTHGIWPRVLLSCQCTGFGSSLILLFWSHSSAFFVTDSNSPLLATCMSMHRNSGADYYNPALVPHNTNSPDACCNEGFATFAWGWDLFCWILCFSFTWIL